LIFSSCCIRMCQLERQRSRTSHITQCDDAAATKRWSPGCFCGFVPHDPYRGKGTKEKESKGTHPHGLGCICACGLPDSLTWPIVPARLGTFRLGAASIDAACPPKLEPGILVPSRLYMIPTAESTCWTVHVLLVRYDARLPEALPGAFLFYCILSCRRLHQQLCCPLEISDAHTWLVATP
jgi:hypothetical protein